MQFGSSPPSNSMLLMDSQVGTARQYAALLLSRQSAMHVCYPQVLGDHELEPMSKSLLAAPHSMCELRALLCKTVITIADILLKPLPHVQVVLYTIACGLLFYYHARMVRGHEASIALPN